MSKSQIVPPKRFRPAGVVEWVRWSATPPPFVKTKRKYGKRAEGLRYERKVHENLLDRYGEEYLPSPWFIFKELGVDRQRWCQPDGLLILPYTGQITIIECKLQHTSAAWWQLKWLYLPVVARAFPPDLWKYGVVEVVKWYDPAALFPEKVRMLADITEAEPNDFNVHILKP